MPHSFKSNRQSFKTTLFDLAVLTGELNLENRERVLPYDNSKDRIWNILEALIHHGCDINITIGPARMKAEGTTTLEYKSN